MFSEEAFAAFMQKTYRIFAAYCISRKQKPENIDEIVNEAFLRLWCKWETRVLCSEDQNKKWMFNTIHYILMEQARDRMRNNADNIDDHAGVLSDTTEIDEHLLYQSLLHTIQKNLTESEYQLFTYVFLQKTDSRIIMEVLDLNQQTLWKRISRLKTKLKEILKNF